MGRRTSVVGIREAIFVTIRCVRVQIRTRVVCIGDTVAIRVRFSRHSRIVRAGIVRIGHAILVAVGGIHV